MATAKFIDNDPAFWPDAVPGDARYIHRLAVRRQYAGTGIAQAIIEWAKTEALRANCSYLRLDCDSQRQRLRKLYLDMGFSFVDELEVKPFIVARF